MNKETFILAELSKKNDETLLSLLKLIDEDKRVIFTKFGDGEYYNMTSYFIDKNNMTSTLTQNCDNDKFTYEFGIKLREAFINLCSINNNDVFLGRWYNDDTSKFLLGLIYDNLGVVSVPFVNYQFIYPDYEYHKNNNLFLFVKKIQELNKFKLIVSNNNNKRLSIIFNSNNFLEIPQSSWFAMGLYSKIYDYISNILNNFPNALIIFAAGMGSKILISNLASNYRNASFIDIGSGFDILATKKDTRDWHKEHRCKKEDNYTFYEHQVNYFKELLPEDF